MNRAMFLRQLESVYAETWRAVPDWCRRHGLDEQLTRDALQDLVLEICEHWTRPPDARLLKRYIKCRVLTALRRRRSQPVGSAPGTPRRPDESALESERAVRVNALVERCSQRERQVVALVENDVSLRSAARRLGANRHEVDALWRRICERFRAGIEDAV